MTYTQDQQDALDNMALWSKTTPKVPEDLLYTLDGAAGTGKAQPNSSLILTDKGYDCIGNIKIGNTLYTEKGKETKVTGVFPQGLRDIYKINFNDNTFVLCDLEHIWYVSPREKRGKMSYRNMTTRELLESKIINQTIRDIKTNRKGSLKWQVPLCMPIQHTQKDLEIHPYVLGVLIGDGYLKGSCATIYNPLIDKEVIEKVSELLSKEGYAISRNTRINETCASYNIVKDTHNEAFIKKVKSLNLDTNSLNKFIPNEYFLGSALQRIQLLKGLMDTDGTIGKNGSRSRYSTSSYKLANDVISLVQSLGGKATLNSNNRNINIEYTVNLLTPMNCFYLKRKAELWRKPKITKYIESIENTGKVEDATCISVDNIKKLYITNNYIVTHNTTIIRTFLQNSGLRSSQVAVTAPTHKAKKQIQRATDYRGETIQKLLGLKPDVNMDDFDINKPVFATIGEDAIQFFKVVIIDESSMLNKEAFKLIKERALRYKVRILFMGDAYQLPPVGEEISLVFSSVKNKSTLTTVVRQGDDNPMSPILKILRADVKYGTDNGIKELIKLKKDIVNDKGFNCLPVDKFGTAVLPHFFSSEYKVNKDHIKFLAYTNDSVEKWSIALRKQILKEDAKNLLNVGEAIMAYTSIIEDRTNTLIIENSEDYIITEVIASQSDNYIKGFDITLENEKGSKRTVFVVDHTDKANLIEFRRIAIDNLTLAQNKRGYYWKKWYQFKHKHLLLVDVAVDPTIPIKQWGNLLCKKDLYYGYGCTVHKSQGSTYDNVAINLINIYGNYNTSERARLVYVALSRTKNINLILVKQWKEVT